MARVLTLFFRQISWASGIHWEGFFPIYRGRVLPRGQYPLGWVSCTWEIPTSVSFFSWPYLLRFESHKLTHPRGGTAVRYYLVKFDCTTCFHSLSLEIFRLSCGGQEFWAHVYVMRCWQMLGPIISPILAAWPPIISELFFCVTAP